MRELLVGVFVLLVATNAYADDQTPQGWSCFDKQDISDAVVSKDGVRINNFNIKERKGNFDETKTVIDADYAVLNKNAGRITLIVQFVGLSQAGKVTFAVSAAPMMSMVSGASSEQAHGDIYVEPGTYAGTAKVCFHVGGL